jgi:hypothetical protein
VMWSRMKWPRPARKWPVSHATRSFRGKRIARRIADWLNY